MACSAQAFAQFLVNQQPHYDKLILRDITPRESWIGHVSTGTQMAGVGNILYQDRLHGAYPDTTQEWTVPNDATCVGSPCDPTENRIGYGASRRSYTPLKQSWASDLFCLDQMISISNARETFNQFVSGILKPATTTIMSGLFRKQALFWADKKWVANGNMADFDFVWQKVGTSETYMLTNQIPTSLLLPQMLQRQVQPLTARGYFGDNPYSGQDMLPLIELVTDMDTLWSLDHLGGITGVGGTPSIVGNWRFQQWDAASKFWRYGLSGQIGNYAARVDPEQLRFNYAGPSGNATYPYKFQVVLPFRNVASSGAGGAPGIKLEPNPDWFAASYRMSFIWHKKAMEALTQEIPTINPEMPFMKRNLAGKWQFVMDNLTNGCDANGNPIAVDNARRNKGKFIADFWLWIRPLRTEFAQAIFHLGEPLCFTPVSPCVINSSYPAQNYSSANDLCEAE
jgi:hypothetical protein